MSTKGGGYRLVKTSRAGEPGRAVSVPLFISGGFMPKPVVKKAVLRLPQVETRRVWVGSYGGHFSVVVVFSKKPKKAGRQAFNPGEYCELLNKDIIAGKFAPDAFEVWFGVRIVATSTQIMSVEPYDLTAVWDDYGQVFGLNTPVD